AFGSNGTHSTGSKRTNRSSFIRATRTCALTRCVPTVTSGSSSTAWYWPTPTAQSCSSKQVCRRASTLTAPTSSSRTWSRAKPNPCAPTRESPRGTGPFEAATPCIRISPGPTTTRCARSHPSPGWLLSTTRSSTSSSMASCCLGLTPSSRSAVWLGRAQPAYEVRDRGADLVGTVLLDEMASGDGGFGQVRPGADELADTTADDGARFGIDEQLGHVAFGQPVAVALDHRDDVGRLAVDGHVARPGQRRPAVFTRVGERLPVVVHLVFAQRALYLGR